MMRTVLLCCVIASALAMSPYWGNFEEEDEGLDYICPDEAHQIQHLSYCAWDPCEALANPHPCKGEPEAYCKYNACPNVHCDLQFFVGNRWVNCTLDEDAFLMF